MDRTGHVWNRLLQRLGFHCWTGTVPPPSLALARSLARCVCVCVCPETLTVLPLLDRGMVYAIAHIRGGGEMGQSWYREQGKVRRLPPSLSRSLPLSPSLPLLQRLATDPSLPLPYYTPLLVNPHNRILPPPPPSL